MISTVKAGRLNTRTRERSLGASMALGIMLLPGLFATPSAQGQTLTTLYSFKGGDDGANPGAGVIRDGAGNLYGTTEDFGAPGCGCGTVFKLDVTGEVTVLHEFTFVADGANPFAGVIRDAPGDLYGTAQFGGDLTCNCGAVYKLDAAGQETLLHSFTGKAGDGANPLAGVIRDAAGNLYGTTAAGGSASSCGSGGCGTVFKLDATGKESVLYNFTNAADGGFPYAGVIRDAAGNLYGTTQFGGDRTCGCGTVFKLDTSGKESVLYSFTGKGGGGQFPQAGVIRDAAGNLYGTTFVGGAFNNGTVFKLNSAGKDSVLHSFKGQKADGANPSAGLIRDAAGNLYGTTQSGGALNGGTVYELSATGKESLLYSFTSGADGGFPLAGVIRDAAGNLYGTTQSGGTSGFGTVFKIAP
jgi:uncharacterized repeat protein (TIGR03803 family)